MGWQNEHILWIFNFPLFHSSSLIDWEPRFKLQSRVETKGMCTLTLTNEKGWKTFTMVFNLSCSAAFWLFHMQQKPNFAKKSWLKKPLLFIYLSFLSEKALVEASKKRRSWIQNIWPNLTRTDNLSVSPTECMLVRVYVCMCVASQYDMSV